MRGTTKAAEMVDNPDCPSLCAVSVYDTKTVHFLSMCNSAIHWIKKSRQVYKTDGKDGISTIDIINDYNMGMGYVDINDRLQGLY